MRAIDFLIEYNEQQQQDTKNRLFKSGAIEVLYNGPDYLIAIPHTKEASCSLGKNTKWCTASKTHGMFDKYNKAGDLYVIFDKKNNKKWQFHFETRQYADEQDNPINVDAFIKTHKKAVNIILKNYGGLEKAAIADPYTWGRYIENPSEEMQLLAVKQNGRALRYIIKKGIIPSEAVQLAAVMKEHDAIKYIIKAGITPSEAVQQAANM